MTAILVVAFTVYGISATFWEGMIFWKFAYWADTTLPWWIYKPLCGCVICMTPWWGSALCFLLDWPAWYVIPAMGINAIIIHLKKDD